MKLSLEQLSATEDKITLDASIMEDLGADSLDTVELVMAIEEEFEIEIPDSDAEEIQTVQDALSSLKMYLKAKNRDQLMKSIAKELKVNEDKVTGTDSLAKVEIVKIFESEFDIEIPDSDAEEIQTVQDALSYLDIQVSVD